MMEAVALEHAQAMEHHKAMEHAQVAMDPARVLEHAQAVIEHAQAAMDHAQAMEQAAIERAQAALDHAHAHAALEHHGLPLASSAGLLHHGADTQLLGATEAEQQKLEELAAAQAQLHHLLPPEFHTADPAAQLHLTNMMQQALQAAVDQQQHHQQVLQQQGMHMAPTDLDQALLQQAIALAALGPLSGALPTLDANGQPTYTTDAAAAAAAAAAVAAAAAAATVPQSAMGTAGLALLHQGHKAQLDRRKKLADDGMDALRGERKMRKRSEKKRKRAERELQVGMSQRRVHLGGSDEV